MGCIVVVGRAERTTLTRCCSLLTHTEDVETKPLRDRFADQLVREAVEPDMSAQVQVTLLFVLSGTDKTNR